MRKNRGVVMPNWCTTTYAFTGEPDALKRFRIDLQNYTSKNYHENGFGETWLGNVISGFGLYPTEGNDATFSYRGNILQRWIGVMGYYMLLLTQHGVQQLKCGM